MSEAPEGLKRLRPSTDDSTHIPQLDNPRTQDVFTSIVKGRKSWKTARGGEVVWPPELEAALIEGLENYKPDDSRETRLLGRFPLRNRFISDWIFEKTGKRRTAKQVGSRLQQLRDTCGGKRLINLISPRRPIPVRTSSSLSPKPPHRAAFTNPTASPEQEGESCSDTSSPSSPTTPTEVHATLQSLLYRGIALPSESSITSVVYIDLLSNLDSGLKGLVDVPNSPSDDDSLFWSERGLEVVKISSQPRYIMDIDPTISFVSRSPKSGVSLFSLYQNGELIHSESTSLKALGMLPGSDSQFLYSTSLIPSYWQKLAHIPNLSSYSIIHRVVEDNGASALSRPVLFSTMYKFRYPTSAYSPVFASSQRLDEVPIHKDAVLDYAAFDNLLSMSSSDGYSTDSSNYDKSQNLYDIGCMKHDWSGYPADFRVA
ncbi:hypothetical protein CC1G_04606 [Coprinopsis cinerea okayama7|uniref:TEA domain-containing protein n=1 Tax=Coprinopsis cinerea (strain Okayama-7 / 130 / ATCC MYA-4618 / FGSC 9003) TaxID=240176 RepID=A8N528_COPC7|nr:hypothetical protein CC1G_04606 [Coprinopsis cinerea okayama7\|eukprot:XP_001829917.1 hypothetical protein CC1G_04606 [Coprinopsis cinerea okayama7\